MAMITSSFREMGGPVSEIRETLPANNLLEGTGGLLRPPPQKGLKRGMKEPIRDLSVRQPAALCFC